MEEELQPLENKVRIIDAEVPDTDINEDGVPSDEGSPSPTVKIIDTDFQVDLDLEYKGLDTEDYTDYLGKDVYVPTGGIDAMNTQRANNQSWYEQAGSMLGQAVVGEIVGGTIEGFGYLLDVESYVDLARGKEDEWGNWLSDIGKDLRQGAQEAMPIYQRNEGTFDMSDSGWWFSNGVSVASSLSMLVPATAGAKALSFLGKGMSKGAGLISKSMDIASKMGKAEKWMANGVTQAVVSRHIENSMEASGTFESARNEYLNEIDPETGVLFTEEKANQLAADAAASNYRMGWAMLAQDIPQYLAIGKIFNPKTMRMESALSKATQKGKSIKMKPWQKKAAGLGGTFVSEGAEESYQYYIAERGKLLSDLKAGLITEEEYSKELASKVGDTEMMTSAFWGGLGGNIFQAVGPATQNLFKSKEKRGYEKNYAKMQGDFLKKRGEAFSVLQKELADADQKGDPLRREMVINEMMMGMTVEALELDKFEQHIESLQNAAKMSKEEKEAFEKEQGIELNEELFKKYIPEIINSSEKIRQDYLRHLNKNDSSVAASLAMKDAHIRSFGKRKEDVNKSIAEIKKNAPGYNEISPSFRRNTELSTKMKAIDIANSVHKSSMGKTSVKREKDALAQLIKENEDLKEEYKKEAEELKGSKKTPDQVINDREYKDGIELAAEEMLQEEAENVLLSNGIKSRQREMKFLKSDDFKREQKKKRFQEEAALITTKEEADTALINLEQNEEFTDEEKDEIKKGISKRVAKIEREEKIAAAKAKAAEHAEELAKKNAAKKQASASTTPASNSSSIGDGIEDVSDDEDIDFEDSVSAMQESKVNKSVKASKSLSLLDSVPGTEGFQKWKANQKEKVGTKVTLVEGDEYNGMAENERKALNDFISARASGGEATQEMYDYLPLKVLVNPSVHTFLPTKNAKSDFYETNYAEQRKVIIDRLVKGENVETTISHTSGGELITDYDKENLVVPEHSVLDLKQINSVNEAEIMVTDREGRLMNTAKELHPDYAGDIFTVGSDKTDEGNSKPYRGGLFLNVKKADGTKFPLKLNFMKNTPEQASLLSRLIIATNVKGANGISIKPSNPLSTIDEKLREEVERVMGPELSVLGKDPKVGDIIEMFVYVNDKTKGLRSELYQKNGVLIFGEGKKIALDNMENEAMISQLTDFLTNVKRRQFNLRLNSEFPGYKKFILENRIVNTNATITEDLFQSTNRWENGEMVGKRIGTWIAPIEKPVDDTIVIQSGSKQVPAEMQKRMNRTKVFGVKPVTETGEGSDGKFFTMYYGKPKPGSPISPNRQVTGKTEAEVVKKAQAKYDAELSKLPEKKVVKIPHTPAPTETEDGSPILSVNSIRPKVAKVDKKVVPLDNKTDSELAAMLKTIAGNPQTTPASRKLSNEIREEMNRRKGVKRNPSIILGAKSMPKANKNLFAKVPKENLEDNEPGKINKDCKK